MLIERLKKTRWLKKYGHSIQLAYPESDYCNKYSYHWFVDNVYLLSQGLESGIDFDDKFYLNNNADIAHAVSTGNLCCGYIHFCTLGKFELRVWSSRKIYEFRQGGPVLATGIAEPKNIFPLPRYRPDLRSLPDAKEKTLLILIPFLTDDLFFAGYTGFFSDMSSIFPDFAHVKVIVGNPNYNERLLDKYGKGIEVIPFDKIGELTELPTLIYCFDTETFFQAKDVFGNLDRVVYYCQDFESGFYPYGSMYVRSQTSLHQSKNIVFSTGILANSIISKGLLRDDVNCYVTAPHIEPFDAKKERSKKLFFYYRPEAFNSRNMPELIMRTVIDFCHQHCGYEIYLVGAVGTSFSQKINGTDVIILSKLAKNDYLDLISACDAVVALIYSDHPGVIAYQTAASGIPTITNTFGIRDADYIEAISSNLVPFDPIRESLSDKIEFALTMPKGNRDFNLANYEQKSQFSFSDFNSKIMETNRSHASDASE